MIVVDASVAIKWFVTNEPLVAEAGRVLAEIERDPSPYVVPDLFMNELLAVLVGCLRVSRQECRKPWLSSKRSA